MQNHINRRTLLGGMVGGAVALAVGPAALAKFGPPPGIISLRYNENPYGPSAKAIQAASRALRKGAYYAEPGQEELFNAISAKHGVTRENLFLSSGSNEALHAAMVTYSKDGKVVTAAHTYSDHVSYSKRLGVEFIEVPLSKDMSIDLEGMASAVDDSVSLVYVCNPNNPTGMTLDGNILREFCRSVSKQAVILVDEAYNELTDDPEYTSMIDLVRDGENVLVMRTFSKIFGMAGLRVGYGIGRPDIAQRVFGHVMAWPNSVGLAAATASYVDDDFIQYSRNKVVQGRAMVNSTLEKNGIQPLPSQTNFIYADIGRSATEFQQELAARNIWIRGAIGSFDNYSRISMGRIEELEIFDEVFTEVYNS